MDKLIVASRALLKFFGLVGLLCCSSTANSEEILIVGDSQHPPFSYIEDGQAKGVYAEIVQATLKRMPSYSVRIELYPWKRALEKVKSGEAQAIFPPHFFPNRRPFIRIYSHPLMDEYASVFCNTNALKARGIELGSPVSWPKDLLNARFVLSRGVKMGGDAFWEAVNSGKISAEEVNGPENAIRMIISGRMDCHINDRVTIEWYLKMMSAAKADNNVRLVLVIAEEAGYLATSSAWEENKSQAFINAFNHQLLSIIKNGTQEDIIEDYVK